MERGEKGAVDSHQLCSAGFVATDIGLAVLREAGAQNLEEKPSANLQQVMRYEAAHFLPFPHGFSSEQVRRVNHPHRIWMSGSLLPAVI